MRCRSGEALRPPSAKSRSRGRKHRHRMPRCGKRGRAVEGTGLENQRRGDSFVGSNPTASAVFTYDGWQLFQTDPSSDPPQRHACVRPCASVRWRDDLPTISLLSVCSPSLPDTGCVALIHTHAGDTLHKGRRRRLRASPRWWPARVIKDAGHPGPKVTRAARLADGKGNSGQPLWLTNSSTRRRIALTWPALIISARWPSEKRSFRT